MSGKHSKPGGWRGSAAQIAVGRAAITRWNRIRHLQPKCGAARKRDGEPCENLAMANGRCRCHGGRTPKGDRFHLPVWPNGNAPDAEKKLQRKLADRARAAKKRAARLDAMSPEQRKQHDAWHAARKPGSAAGRRQARSERKQAAEVRAMLSTPRVGPTGEAAELETQIVALRAELEARRQNEQKPIGAFA